MDSNLAGRTFGGRYDVLHLLGAGGMGEVYRARDRELDELVALKVIRAEHTNPAMVAMFRHEVKLARRVTHINIARMFELGFADDVMYCTMELVEGESLRTRIERLRALSLPDAAAITTAVCNGLEVAHAAGVIHRDIKPENVLLGGRVVLADFGVAAIASADADGRLVGTLEYMAPEQARGEAPTPATDIYALGIMLFEMLTGARAFTGTMAQILTAKQEVEKIDLARVPAEVRDVIARATAFEPLNRYASARDLAAALAPWASTEPLREVPRETLRDIDTVVVLAPKGDPATLHLAQGVHSELLRRLARLPHLRVWPRMEALGPHMTTISLEATHALVVTIERLSGLTTLHLPLDIAQLNVAASTIVGALSDPPSARRPSFELLLRARAVALGGFSRMPEACALLHEAHTLDPADPTIAAELAAMLMRHHFMGGLFQQAFTLAPALVQQAIASAPHAAETHVAAAHLELHRGDPVVAANEFREAIACSPYLAEPHEGLGRMLLEAGFLADAVSRIEDALAIAPEMKSVKWEIARAHALEKNWGVHDALVAELQRSDDRPMARLRFALWRGDRETARKMRAAPQPVGFDFELYARGLAAVADGTWAEHRARIIELAMSNPWQSRRGNAFLATVGAETAAWCNDGDACLQLLRAAAELGTFDRHWLERSPSLAFVRGTDEFRRIHRIVSDRAHAIHDALFRDREAYRDTVLGA